MKKEIAIIGAGIGGLYTAYKLKNKHRITVFEKEDEIGGLFGSFCLSDKKIKLEKSYHHIFGSDKEIIKLIDELGLSDKLIWKKENNAIVYGQKVYSFCGPIDLLKFPLLSLIDKLRLGLVTLYLQKEKKYKKFEKELAYRWLRRYCGEKVYKIIWKPLLKNKFGDKYKEISMTWFWARIHFRGSAKLGYLKGGFGQIIEKLSKKIKIVKKEVEAKDLTKYDLIVDTSPLKSVEYLGAINVIFTSKQYLSKYYWHNINEEGAPFVAFINQTNMVDDYGKNVYYLGGYYPQNHRYFKVKDEIIYKEFFEYLKQIWPEFEEKEVAEKYIFKFKNAQHINCPPLTRGGGVVGGVCGIDNAVQQTPPPSGTPLIRGEQKVVHMNFAQIYPQDRGVNYAIKMAKKVVASFL